MSWGTVLTCWAILSIVLTAFLCLHFKAVNARAEREQSDSQAGAQGSGQGSIIHHAAVDTAGSEA